MIFKNSCHNVKNLLDSWIPGQNQDLSSSGPSLLESRTLKFEAKTKKNHLLGVLLLLLFFTPHWVQDQVCLINKYYVQILNCIVKKYLRDTSWRTDTGCVLKGTWGLGT